MAMTRPWAEVTDSPFMLLVTATALFWLVYRYLLYPALLSPLAKIPAAHWSATISPLWILTMRFTKRENRTLLAAHRRLGPVVRVGPGQLSISDAESVRTVYQGGFERTGWYAVFDNYGVPCMFSMRTGRAHAARKRLLAHAYAKSTLQTSAAGAAQAHAVLAGRLLPLLARSAHASQAPHGVDVHALFLAAAMDLIAAHVFGLRGGTDFVRDAAYRDHWLALYQARADYGFFPQELPRLTALCRRWLRLSLYPAWVDAANEELRQWNRGLCDAVLDGLAAEEDGGEKSTAGSADDPVVARALLAGLATERASVDRLTVYSELLDHVLAGQETSGVTLTYLSWRLSQLPGLQQQLRAELLGLQPSMKLDADGASCALPDARQLDALPILHAVVMETLRLHAPLPGPEPRETPPAGCQLSGRYRVPGGVRVAALPYTLHRDPSVFPDPERWDHTRWLDEAGQGGGEAASQRRRAMQRQFWAFGSGGRMCIGSNFAMLAMKRITAAIYSNFTTHLVDDAGMAEPVDGYAAPPSSARLYLRFEPVR